MKNKNIWILLIVSFIVRLLFAASVELGNDEAYYRIFALFPDWSYFDHPPMVAWLIRITTFGAEATSEIFVRLGSIIIGTINTYIIYRIAQGGKPGFIAALLYTGSIYASIILGTFILPDTPLSLFWLLTLWIFIKILPAHPSSPGAHKYMLLAGVFIGLAMLSKYSGGYLWFAAMIYIIIYNKSWLRQWSLWCAIGISLVLLIPVIYWNVNNDWISFAFHGDRIAHENSINWLYFGREIMGTVLYNNPVNFVIIVCAILALVKHKQLDAIGRLLLIFSIPLILGFIIISITRETLPHWSAPAYFALILLAARWLHSAKWAYMSVGLTALVMTLGLIQINYGLFDVGGKKEGIEIGRGDFSLDTYGWRQGGGKFAELHKNYVALGLMPANASLLQYGWDDAAHIDTYFGLPLGLQTKTIGALKSIHHYQWINEHRGGFAYGEDMYLINTSRFFREAENLYGDKFQEIHPADTIKIYRQGKHVMNYYVYRMKGMKTGHKYNLNDHVPVEIYDKERTLEQQYHPDQALSDNIAPNGYCE